VDPLIQHGREVLGAVPVGLTSTGSACEIFDLREHRLVIFPVSRLIAEKHLETFQESRLIQRSIRTVRTGACHCAGEFLGGARSDWFEQYLGQLLSKRHS